MNKNKRQVIKALSVSGIVGASVPDRWVRPVVQHVVLPAHAQTSEIETNNTNSPRLDSIELDSQCGGAPDDQFHRVTFESNPPLPGDTVTITPLSGPVPLPPPDGMVVYANNPGGGFNAVVRTPFTLARPGILCTYSGDTVSFTQEIRITVSVSADVTFTFSGTPGGPYQIVVSDITVLP